MVAALEAAAPELASRISPALRPESAALPWATYEIATIHERGSVNTGITMAMVVTIWHPNHQEARAIMEKIGAAALVVDGDLAWIDNGSSTADQVDAGQDDAERAITFHVMLRYSQPNGA